MFAQTQPVEVTTIELTTTESTGLLAGLAAIWLIWLIFAIVLVIANWKIFEKAEEPGWKAIVPLYNTYTAFRIAGRNGWWFLALFVPLVNIVVLVMYSIDLAKHFGKSAAYGVFLLFLFSAVGQLMLGFGDAKYVGVKHQ